MFIAIEKGTNEVFIPLFDDVHADDKGIERVVWISRRHRFNTEILGRDFVVIPFSWEALFRVNPETWIME